jgi:hypothetical protein
MSFIKALLVAVIVIVVAYVALTMMGIQGAGYMAMMGNLSIGQAIAIGAISGFTGGFVGALLNGASPGDALIAGLTGAVIGGITAGLTSEIAGVLGHTGNYLRRAIAHGVVSGVMRLAQGGNFLNGFMSTFFSTIAGGIKVGAGWAQGAFQTLVGGTASLIGGGKFANGAVSAAMVWLFNDNSGEKKLPVGGDRKNNLIFLDKAKDPYLYDQISKMKFKNIFVLGGHGGYGGFIFHKYDMTLDELYMIIQNSGKSEVLLIACDQGTSSYSSFSQIIANNTGLSVQYSLNNVSSILGIPFSVPFPVPFTENGNGAGSLNPWRYTHPK